VKRRLVISFLSVTTVVLILLAVPLAYLLQRVANDESTAQLDQQASYLVEQVVRSLDLGLSVRAPALDSLIPPSTSAVIILPDGSEVRIHDSLEGDLLSATASDPSGVRVSLFTSAEPVRDRVNQPLIILGGLGLAGLLTTWLLAQAEARRLGGPLRDLAATAARLGSGDFSVRAPRSGIEELDSLAATLDASAARIDALVRAERSFSSDAGHQLRSALTGLRLRLEELAYTDDPEDALEVQAALEQADRLNATIDALLRLSRTGRAGVATRFDLRSLVVNHVQDVTLPLRRDRRRIVINPGPPLSIEGAQGAVGQALDVLLWNATKHGKGTVTIDLGVRGRWAELTVGDEGSMDAEDAETLFSREPRGTHGIGLPLARRIIESESGQLVITSTSPTTFRIRLPLSTEAP